MIDASRRGYMEGYAYARIVEQSALALKSELCANACWRSLKGSDYAHIEPQADFISGFVSGFHSFYTHQSSEHERK